MHGSHANHAIKLMHGRTAATRYWRLEPARVVVSDTDTPTGTRVPYSCYSYSYE